jgi:glucose/arabinose dehydrogenase
LKARIITPLVVAILFLNPAANGVEPPLDKLIVPVGFHIGVYAEVAEARQMALGDDGTVYVGSSRSGRVHAVLNPNRDDHAKEVIVLDDGLTLPTGVAIHQGDLYVGAVDRILRYRNISDSLHRRPEPEVVTKKLPDVKHHGRKFIDFGPDGLLYIPVGAPCNICKHDNRQFAAIHTLDVSTPTSALKTFAMGVRNSVGFDWHPVTGELWFTDNGRDQLGDEIPPCELNHAPRPGMHFGFPHFHGAGLADPEFGEGWDAAQFTAPAQLLGPHVAPLGMTFYTGTMFPEKYWNQIIIPEHGSWNRSRSAGHTGYRLTLVTLKDNQAVSYEPFVTGWLQQNRGWGRPVHALVLPDGSLLVSDDRANVIYRISYESHTSTVPLP